MNTAKTILITTPYFPPEGGGLERYALQVSRFLRCDYGWRVVVVCSNENRKDDSEEMLEDIKIYRLGRDIRLSNTPLGFGWSNKIKKIIEKEKPDIINVHTPVPGLGDLTSYVGRNIPQVITYHTGSMRKENFLDIFILLYEKAALGFMLRRAKSVVCSSDFVRTGFLKKYIAKSETITPGVDAENFTPNPERKSQNPTVLFVAKMENGQEHKGLKTLLDAMKILKEEFPNIKLSVVGDGDLKDGYEAYAADCGLKANVEFRGRLEGKELARAYQAAHIFTLPTSSDSQPLVILEAMATGLPIVSTEVGGIPTMITDNKEGFLIEPHNPRALADKIGILLRDPQLRERFSKAARARVVQNFSWQRRMERYNDMLERAIG